MLFGIGDMPLITITRTIRSVRRVNAAEFIKDEMVTAMETLIIPRIEGYFQNVVDQWSAENRPEIETEKTETPDSIEWYIRPVGDEAKIWGYVTNGTKPHKILPKRGKALRFRWGGPRSYTPKTGFGGQYRGSGKTTGPTRFFKGVNHPGNKPRNFEKHFKRWINPAFRKESEAAVKRGVRKFEKQP